MHRVFVLAMSVVAASAASAAADSPNLKGSYGFTGTAACIVAPGHVGDPNGAPLPNPTPFVALANSGFNPALQVKDVAGSYSHSFAVEGIRTFNGNGTGTVKGTSVGVTVRPTPGPGGFPHFPPSAGSHEFSFSFTYTVNGDGSWTATMVPGSYSATHVTGPRSHFNPNNPVDQTSTVDAIPPVTGMVSQDGKTLIAAHITTAVETHTFSNGDVDPQICHRSRVSIKLQNDGDHD
jgi:hypothetical protein